VSRLVWRGGVVVVLVSTLLTGIVSGAGAAVRQRPHVPFSRQRAPLTTSMSPRLRTQKRSPIVTTTVPTSPGAPGSITIVPALSGTNQVARAKAAKPSIGSFTAMPTSLPFGGGTVAVSASVSNASICTLSANPTIATLPLTTSCAAGTFATTVTVAANTKTKTAKFTLHFSAKGTNTAKAKPIKLIEAPYSPAPVVTSIDPASGPLDGGTAVVITGVNFADAQSVKFGTARGTVTADSATSITATSPAERAGTVDVTVTTAKGTSRTLSADRFTYSDVVTPCDGSITEDSEIAAGSYSVDCTIDVPANLNLRIDPGTILKFGSRAEATVEGTLNAQGTASQPITFTSINDNSVGGDTGSGSPEAGDWYGISVTGSGSVNLQDATMDYAGAAVQASGSAAIDATSSTFENSAGGVYADTSGSITVSDNSFDSISGPAVSVTAPAPTIENNTASNVGTPGSYSGQSAYEVDASALNPDLLVGNSATGGWPLFSLTGSTVGSSGTLPAGGAPWLLSSGNSSSLDVPAGVTLTIAPGAVFKGTFDPYCCGDYLTVEGTLNAQGTASQPITFTSINDNSVGGDTGSGSPEAGDWYGISVTGSGSVNLQDATMDYAGAAVQASGSAAIDATSSTFENSAGGVYADTSGSITVSDNSFDSISGPAVSVTAPAPTIENNTASNVGTPGSYSGQSAYEVDASALNPDLLVGNSATGGWPLFSLTGSTVGSSGTLPAGGAPWLLSSGNSSSLDVPAGVTLTIAPGAVFKGTFDPYCCGDYLTVEGTLNAQGTASQPITFTSINDNSVGGDTGSGSPEAGDWYGISVTGSGSVNLQDATMDYAGAAVQASGSAAIDATSSTFENSAGGVYADTSGSITVSDNSFDSISGPAVSVTAPAPTIENNTASNVGTPGSYSGQSAYEVDASALNPDLLVGNSATGGWPLFSLTGSTVGSSGTLPAGGAPWLLSSGNSSSLDVPAGVTLTIAPGAVFKGTFDPYCCGDYLTVEGTLNAQGTASQPITFTSINDNSVGGDTGSGSPEAGDWYGISVTGSGSVNLQDATMDYAGAAVQASGSAAIDATSSTFENSAGGVYADTSGSITVSDNSFDSISGPAVSVTAPAPTIENNTASNVGTPGSYSGQSAYEVDASALNPDLLVGNSATGGWPLFSLTGSTVGSSGTLPAGGAPWLLSSGNSSSLDVPAGVTLTIAPGAVFKGTFDPYCCGDYLTVEGTLNAQGTASQPITFTSINDNSVGGDTGSGSPEAGDWYGISVSPAATFNGDYVTVEYASVGVSVATDGSATIHGSLLNDDVGVSGGDTWVDASDVNWGDPSGPAPIGTGTLVEGAAVNIEPWVGEAPPTTPAVTPAATPDNQPCPSVFFIGVAGSGEGGTYSDFRALKHGRRIRSSHKTSRCWIRVRRSRRLVFSTPLPARTIFGFISRRTLTACSRASRISRRRYLTTTCLARSHCLSCRVIRKGRLSFTSPLTTWRRINRRSSLLRCSAE
jgi:hypothetical protein